MHRVVTGVNLRKHIKWNVNIKYERKCYWNEDTDVQIESLIVFQENEMNHYNICNDAVN